MCWADFSSNFIIVGEVLPSTKALKALKLYPEARSFLNSSNTLNITTVPD